MRLTEQYARDLSRLSDLRIGELEDLYRAAQREIEAMLRRGGPELTIEKRLRVERALRQLERELSDRAERGFEQAGHEAAELSQEQAVGVATQAGVDFAPARIDPLVTSNLLDAGRLIRGVGPEMLRNVQRSLAQASAGMTDFEGLLDEIGQHVESGIGRAEAIARTEIHKAAALEQRAQQGDLKTLGVDVIKRWRTLGDDRVRIDHAMIDGQERELDEPFNVGAGATADTEPGGPGFELDLPTVPGEGEEEESDEMAAQVINCRCYVVTVPRAQARSERLRNAETVSA